LIVTDARTALRLSLRAARVAIGDDYVDAAKVVAAPNRWISKDRILHRT
jgi:hypothetical protein